MSDRLEKALAWPLTRLSSALANSLTSSLIAGFITAICSGHAGLFKPRARVKRLPA